jgi:small subunit ribosomal protein S8
MYYDLLAKIKNAQRAKKEIMLTPFSKGDFAVAEVLVSRKFLKSAERRTIGKRQYLEVRLSYKENRPGMTDFKVMSKPSRRLYIGYRELKPIKQNYGMSVLSTPDGILSNRDARKKKVGGEYLFEIW